MKKFLKHWPFWVLALGLLLLWQLISFLALIPAFILPSPYSVLSIFIKDFPCLVQNTYITLLETLLGIFFSIILAFSASFLMQRFSLIYRAFFPFLIFSQNIPTVVIAPILILFLGYGILPKVFLVMLCCFFPITVSVLQGLDSINPNIINLMKTMNATSWQIFYMAKLPLTLPFFFSGIKISFSYAFTSAVVAEWLGGSSGLGVYIIRAKKAYAFEKMFAAILMVLIISILIISLVNFMEKFFVVNKNEKNLYR